MCETSPSNSMESSASQEEAPQNAFNTFQEQLVHLHKDNIYMCKKSFLKSEQLLEKFQNGPEQSIAEFQIKTEQLLARMFQNLEAFQSEMKSYTDQFKKATELHSKPAPKKKSALSLIKTEVKSSSSEDVDMDLSTSPVTSTSVKNPLPTLSVPAINLKPIEAKKTDKEDLETINCDSDDSQKTTVMSLQEIQSVITSLKNESFQFEEEIKCQRVQNGEVPCQVDPLAPDEQQPVIDLCDEPPLADNSRIEFDLTNVTPQQLHEDNVELLELLKVAVDRRSTHEEAMLALQDLDDSSSLSGSVSSMLWSSDEDSSKGSDESGKAEEEVKSQSDDFPEKFKDDCGELQIVLPKRVDCLTDDEIDRLCDLHNINKRKCKRLLKRNQRNLRRSNRIKRRILSSSSSSSTSSDSENDDGTSGLEINNFLKSLNLMPNPNPPEERMDENMAELICENFSNDDSSSTSSSSQTDVEKDESVKKKRKLNSKKEDDDVVFVENCEDVDKDNENSEKSKWRKDSLLTTKMWSDSDSEKNARSSPEVPKPEVPKPKRKRTERKRKKSTDLCSDDDDDSYSSTHLTDASHLSSDNSDIEFFDECLPPVSEEASQGSKKGRKNIRALLSDDQLDVESRRAKDDETQRILRLEEHSKTVDYLLSQCSQHEGFVLDLDVESGTPLITVDPEISHKLKVHQKEGVKFMWEACYESVDMIKNGKKPPTGCILAHCMGLGKTLQVIALVHTLFQHSVTNTNRVLIVCPVTTILNWKREFEIAFALLKSPPNFHVYDIVKESLDGRYHIVKRWWDRTGVLIIGYEAYVSLSNIANDRFIETQREVLRNALVKPGPDLIVCDEGHLIKNGKAKRSRALMQVHTKRRIILTGTPIQNNLKEYYVMVNFVKPNILGTLKEYTNLFVNPIMNGQFMDSTPHDTNRMKKRTHVLNKLLKKTIQRADYSVLKEYLPNIHDYTLYVKLQPLQIELYKNYIDNATKGSSCTEGFWNDFHVTKYICTHPHALQVAFEQKNTKKKKEEDTIEPINDPDVVPAIMNKWWEPLCPENVADRLEFGSKLIVMSRILDEAARMGDKVLVFSGSRVELDVIEHFLKTNGTNVTPHWVPNVDYYRMDGTVRPEDRSQLCDNFNDPSNTVAKVFLIAHRVGGLGLNLTAANRVIIMSSNFNPCHDSQSIFRVYRFGQTKPCFVYRLVALGTMEEKIYKKGVVKLSVSGTVVDKYHIRKHYKHQALQEFYRYNFDDVEKPLPIVPKDKLLAKLLQSCPDIFEYLVHQDLLENRPEEELNDEDKKIAWDEFNQEEASRNAQMHPVMAAPVMAPGGNVALYKVPQNNFNVPSTSAAPSAARNVMRVANLHNSINSTNPPSRVPTAPQLPILTPLQHKNDSSVVVSKVLAAHFNKEKNKYLNLLKNKPLIPQFPNPFSKPPTNQVTDSAGGSKVQDLKGYINDMRSKYMEALKTDKQVVSHPANDVSQASNPLSKLPTNPKAQSVGGSQVLNPLSRLPLSQNSAKVLQNKIQKTPVQRNSPKPHAMFDLTSENDQPRKSPEFNYALNDLA